MAIAAAQVVDAIVARITGLALTGSRVYASRAWPLPEADLPAWRVYAVDETVEPQTVHANVAQHHALQVEIQGVAKANADLDDSLNALALQMLTALFAAGIDALATLRQRVQLSLRRIERDMTNEGEAVVGQVLVTVRAEFWTHETDLSTILA